MIFHFIFMKWKNLKNLSFFHLKKQALGKKYMSYLGEKYYNDWAFYSPLTL